MTLYNLVCATNFCHFINRFHIFCSFVNVFHIFCYFFNVFNISVFPVIEIIKLDSRKKTIYTVASINQRKNSLYPNWRIFCHFGFSLHHLVVGTLCAMEMDFGDKWHNILICHQHIYNDASCFNNESFNEWVWSKDYSPKFLLCTEPSL